jgi:hypothetical protein
MRPEGKTLMKLKIPFLIIFAALMLRCSSGGSFGDFAGGGVIGSPTSSTLAYTDTIRCKVSTKIIGPLDPGGAQTAAAQPTGSPAARVNQQQQYACSCASGTIRFRFAGPSSDQVSSLTQDSTIVWTWTTAGACSVQVQLVNGADTSNWSEPLIVNITE